jgi:hypothetical protein
LMIAAFREALLSRMYKISRPMQIS